MLLARQATLSPHQGLCFPYSQLGIDPTGLALLPMGALKSGADPTPGCPHLGLTEGCDPTLQHCHQCREGTLGVRPQGLRGRSLGGS